jgi:hypothetical protein
VKLLHSGGSVKNSSSWLLGADLHTDYLSKAAAQWQLSQEQQLLADMC